MESISGLPAHPLFVHAPVVLMPLLTLGALLLLARPAWRRRLGIALAAASLVVLFLVQLAISSGEAFDELLDGAVKIDKHESLAETTRLFLIGFVLATVAMAVTDRLARRNQQGWTTAAGPVLLGLGSILAIAATVWMFRTGHEGARLVWSTTIGISRFGR